MIWILHCKYSGYFTSGKNVKIFNIKGGVLVFLPWEIQARRGDIIIENLALPYLLRLNYNLENR